MILDLDKFELLYYLEGCARGSHLRQGVWERAIDEFYHKLNENERDHLFHFSMRDLWECMVHDPDSKYSWERSPKCGEDHFLMFLARFKPGNSYNVSVEHEGQKETVDSFYYQGLYRLDSHRFCEPSYITDIAPTGAARLKKYLQNWPVQELKGRGEKLNHIIEKNDEQIVKMNVNHNTDEDGEF